MVLLLGAKGMLGGQLRKIFPESLAWDREDADVTNFLELREKIIALPKAPEAIINCVAYNDVDGAEENKDLALRLNTEVPGVLAGICQELAIPLVHFSTNYVFDGQKGEYAESDVPNPLSEYAKSKYEGELEIQKHTDRFYIIRTAVLFGPKGESELSKKSFIDIMLALAEKTTTIKAVENEINSLTYVTDLAEQVAKMLQDKSPYGIYHITNSGHASWYELAKETFSITGKNIEVVPVPSSEFPRKAVRPQKSVLINTKLPAMRTWQKALHEFLTSN